MEDLKYCKYAKYIDKGIEQYLICSLTNNYCVHQKFCHRRKKVLNTDDFEECKTMERKENKDGK